MKLSAEGSSRSSRAFIPSVATLEDRVSASDLSGALAAVPSSGWQAGRTVGRPRRSLAAVVPEISTVTPLSLLSLVTATKRTVDGPTAIREIASPADLKAHGQEADGSLGATTAGAPPPSGTTGEDPKPPTSTTPGTMTPAPNQTLGAEDLVILSPNIPNDRLTPGAYGPATTLRPTDIPNLVTQLTGVNVD